jgi:hypothetical protein
MYTLYTETSSLRTLKITLRNLNVSVGSWIRLQYCDSVLLNSQKKPAEQTVYSYGLIDTSFGFPLFLVDSTFKYIYILHRRIKELASGLCLPPSILFSLILTCLSQRRRLTAIGQKNAPTLYLTISIFARNGGREKNYGSHCHGQNLSSASGQYLIKARITFPVKRHLAGFWCINDTRIFPSEPKRWWVGGSSVCLYYWLNTLWFGAPLVNYNFTSRLQYMYLSETFQYIFCLFWYRDNC